MAMINFYGGQTVDHVDGSVTHAFACEYDERARAFESSAAAASSHAQLLTPDWLVDSIEQCKLVDALAYHPKYLYSNGENEAIVAKIQSGQLRLEEEEARRRSSVDSTAPLKPAESTGSGNVLFKSQLVSNALVVDMADKAATTTLKLFTNNSERAALRSERLASLSELDKARPVDELHRAAPTADSADFTAQPKPSGASNTVDLSASGGVITLVPVGQQTFVPVQR